MVYSSPVLISLLLSFLFPQLNLLAITLGKNRGNPGFKEWHLIRAEKHPILGVLVGTYIPTLLCCFLNKIPIQLGMSIALVYPLLNPNH